MISYEFFVKYLGFSETLAKVQYDKIKNSPTSSISGILRLNDSTLLQKFNFYKTELGYSVAEILNDPRILSYDTSTTLEEAHANKDNANLQSCVNMKIDFLRKKLGLSNEQIKNYGFLSYDPQTLQSKLKLYKEHFGLDISHIKSEPSLLNYDIETLDQKADFYKKHLGFTSKQFKDFPTLFTFDCSEESENPSAIINKIKFYKKVLGFSDSQFKTAPCLLSYDTVSDESVPTSVRAKVKFYHDTLGFEAKHFQKSPSLLHHDIISDETKPSSIKAKIKFFTEFFGFMPEHFQADPGIFSYDCSDSGSPTSVLSKFKYYNETLGLQPEHIRDNTILLHFDIEPEGQNKTNSDKNTSVKEKIAKLREIGITNEDIQANTKLLMTPAADIKNKYALWSTIFPDKRFLELKTWFITRLEKVYARHQYLTKELGMTSLRPQHLDICESQFIKRFKEHSDYLIEKYPIDETIIENFYKSYNELGIEPPLQRG